MVNKRKRAEAGHTGDSPKRKKQDRQATPPRQGIQERQGADDTHSATKSSDGSDINYGLDQIISNSSKSTNDNSTRVHKWENYTRNIISLSITIEQDGNGNFHISDLQYKRIGTGNDGNHIIPFAFFLSLIRHFFVVGNKSYDCFVKAQFLLNVFSKILNYAEEYEVIKNILQEKINKGDGICCQMAIQNFFSTVFIPYLIYIWDTRVSAKHFDSKYDVAQEGPKVKNLNKSVSDLLIKEDNHNFETQINKIRDNLFNVLDIPVIIQRYSTIKNTKSQSIINQYLA